MGMRKVHTKYFKECKCHSILWGCVKRLTLSFPVLRCLPLFSFSLNHGFVGVLSKSCFEGAPSRAAKARHAEDWRCSWCDISNFKDRTYCRECGESRPGPARSEDMGPEAMKASVDAEVQKVLAERQVHDKLFFVVLDHPLMNWSFISGRKRRRYFDGVCEGSLCERGPVRCECVHRLRATRTRRGYCCCH